MASKSFETHPPDLADRFLKKLNSIIFESSFLNKYDFNAICSKFM
jgi:hypothetical protein